MISENSSHEATTHAAFAQFHRWFQIYENQKIPLENSLDMMVPDVTIRSGLGESRGHSSYAQRISALPKHWQNSHFAYDLSSKMMPDGHFSVNASVHYYNIGIKPEIIRKADLRYRVSFHVSNELLPKIASVEIEQVSEGTAASLPEAYPTNRVLSLFHYLMAILHSEGRSDEKDLHDEIFLGSTDADGTIQKRLVDKLRIIQREVFLKPYAIRASDTHRDVFELDLQSVQSKLTLLILDSPARRFGQILLLR